MDDLFGDDPDAAKRARDEAIKRVTEHGGNWQDLAMTALLLIPGFVGTAEDIRIRLIMKDLPKPHHHNAWGAMIQHAVRRGRLLPTGQFRHMKMPRSHARKTEVYIVRDVGTVITLP